jgi:hypothetical protein
VDLNAFDPIAASRTRPSLVSGWGRRVGVFPEGEEGVIRSLRLSGVAGTVGSEIDTGGWLAYGLARG